MDTQPTALLLHTTDSGSHHDWLIGVPLCDPAPPPRAPGPAEAPDQHLEGVGEADQRLWTARVGPPSRQWAGLGEFDLIRLPPHRRRYLTYEGQICGGRGSVHRVDEGWVTPLTWTDRRIILDVAMRDFTGRLELRFLSDPRWRARVLSDPPGGATGPHPCC